MGLDALWMVATGLMAATGMLWVLLLLGMLGASKDKRFVLQSGDDVTLPPSPPKVSIIIPARNEEGFIGRAVSSALAQDYPALEVLVVDDASEDRTAQEATEAGGGDERLRVVPGRPLPDGWLGKPSACWHGQSLSEGEVLLFVDADIVLDPDATRQCVAALTERKLGMLSLWGTWVMESFWEKVAQPVVGGFVRGAHPLDKLNDPKRPEAFANGQFIMIRREDYHNFGGHEAVRAEVLEDVRFAQRAQAAGVRCGMFLAPSLFRVRLYTSLSEIWQGMLKNFYHGMNRQPRLAAAAAAFVSTTTLLPVALLVLALWLGHWPLAVAAGVNVLIMYAFRFVQDGAMGMDRLYGLTHPLGTAILVGIILTSMWRGLRGQTTLWKGRAVQG